MHISKTEKISLDSKTYFEENDFEESMVINLSYSPVEKKVLLVVKFARTKDFINWLNGGLKPDLPTSDFRLLIFEEVENLDLESNLKINPIINSPNGFNFNTKNAGSFMVEFIVFKEDKEILISLISSTKLKFKFNKLSVQQRFGKGIKRKNKNEWDYVDVKIGEMFDFYDPFNLTTA